jgi:hypothetical protein
MVGRVGGMGEEVERRGRSNRTATAARQSGTGNLLRLIPVLNSSAFTHQFNLDSLLVMAINGTNPPVSW